MPRRIGVLAALAAALSLTLIGSSPAEAKAPREFFGLVPQGEAPPTEDIERMGRGRVGTVRLLINWAAVEPTDDNFKWGPVDAYVAELAAQGIRPFPFVWSVPSFVSSNPLEMPVESPQDRAQWQEFLRAAVNRYGPGGPFAQGTLPLPGGQPGGPAPPIGEWQIWNEQNGPKHAKDPSPGTYANLLKISHDAITAEDPGAEIVLGGMFGRPRGGGGKKAWSYLKRLYKSEGVKESFEGVALHPYSPDIDGIKEQLKKIRQVLKKKKDKGADIWITELGWGSSKKGRLGVGTKKQAKLLKQSFKLLSRKRNKWNIPSVMWYTWRDLSSGRSPCDWCTTAGLFKRNGFDAKPAWNKYVRLTGGS